MRASRSRTRDATNLLTSTPDEFALELACALLTARDLLSLRLTCRRFNIQCIAARGEGQRRRRRRCCASWRRRRDGRWHGAASRSEDGYHIASLRAGWV